VFVPYEYGNEHSASIKEGTFLDQLSERQLPKKEFSGCSSLSALVPSAVLSSVPNVAVLLMSTRTF
jgi:hypothetical protein